MNILDFLKKELKNKYGNYSISDLIKFEKLNPEYSFTIRKHSWPELIFVINGNRSTKFLKFYNFINYQIVKIFPYQLKFLSKAHYLDFTRCYNLRNEHLKIFTKCQEINLTSCYQITNRGLFYLKNCNSVNLSYLVN